MFLIVPLIMFSGLLSILTVIIFASLYGLELILLALLIRNVRQETSRDSLRLFLRLIAFDHLLAAVTALSCGMLLASMPGMQRFIPLLQNSGDIDNTATITLATTLAFFTVVWILVAVLLLLISPDLDSRISIHRQLRWHRWTTVMIALGLILSLPTMGVFLIIGVPLIWHVMYSARMSRQATLLWTLAIAIRQGVPLGPEVMALADAFWGRQRLRLQLLSENLDAGMSLASSLERQPGLLPRSVVMMIRMGEETNSVAAALECSALRQSRQQERETDLISLQQAFLLLLIPMMVIPNIVGFLCYFIVPKFKKIFEDFGTELPALTIGMINVADTTSGAALLVFLGTVGGAILLVVINTRDRELDWPLLNVLAPRVNGPPILRALALLIRENRSLTAGIQGLMWSHPRATVRLQLTHINQSLQHGGDLAGCLAEQRLIRTGDVPLLRAAERVRNLPWCLEQLAGAMERRFWYRLRILLEVGYPACVVAMGVVVMLIVAGFFMPLVKLLNDLS